MEEVLVPAVVAWRVPQLLLCGARGVVRARVTSAESLASRLSEGSPEGVRATVGGAPCEHEV